MNGEGAFETGVDRGTAKPPSIILDAASVTKLATLTVRIGEKGFDRRLLTWLSGLVTFDSALVLLYAKRQRPKILVDALDNPDRRNSAQHYIEGAYLLDPFYHRAGTSKDACLLQLADIMPENFHQSDYVENYYRRSAIRDEVNFLIPFGETTYALALERSMRQPTFSSSDLESFRLLLPLLEALVRRHRQLVADRDADPAPDREHLRLERILADFGSQVLTPREREVVGLMLRGFALAQVAGKLKISAETARVHRRNIYEKLDISSLAELFSLALAELADRR